MSMYSIKIQLLLYLHIIEDPVKLQLPQVYLLDLPYIFIVAVYD